MKSLFTLAFQPIFNRGKYLPVSVFKRSGNRPPEV